MGLSVYGPRKPEKAKQDDKKKKTRKKDARRKSEREVEEEQGGSQEKKRKVVEQAPQLLDWLPPELKEDVQKKALYALLQERPDKDFVRSTKKWQNFRDVAYMAL